MEERLVSSSGQQMLSVVRQVDTAIQQSLPPGEASDPQVDLAVLQALAAEPFDPAIVLERLVSDAR
jgi:hypothetical protein